MYYRRRLLLALLHALGGRAEKMRLHKLLLLFMAKRGEAAYHFVPYKFGAFSFQANADLVACTTRGWVANHEKEWELLAKEDHEAALKPADRAILHALLESHGKLGRDALVRDTYQRFPYSALRSEMAPRLLNKQELKTVQESLPAAGPEGLYTIGYEGLDLDAFLNKLIRARVSVLCDVRRNAYSMKYGFSKKQLQNACEGVGIRYEHLPEVGIASDERQELETQADRNALFARYAKRTLPETVPVQEHIAELVAKHHRVAIMCFEHEVGSCHRNALSKSIVALPGFQGELIHL
ncbi:MAG: DUF488 domain-containing protein [Flavobacteriales bacterium]|nr:DUF488 domain-containing protein [Flavobacteriales bacterium]